MNILVLTPYWPSQTHPGSGVFVQRQVDFLRSKGLDVTVFHLKGGGNVINYFKAIVRIRELTKLNSYDLIHAHWGYSSLPALFTNLPLFITFRGSDLMGTYKNGKPTLTGKLIILFSKIASRFAKALIFVSKDLSGRISSNVPRFIIPSGLSFETLPLLNKESTKKKLGLPLDKKVIVFPNDPSREVKRYELFVKTINALNRNDVYPHVIYGISHSELVEHLVASDILLFTSKHEGSPNVIKEALALNLPIVSVNVGDVKERVSGIKGCFVVEEDTPQALSATLEKALVFDYQNYNSRITVKGLDENILVGKLISIYKQYIH